MADEEQTTTDGAEEEAKRPGKLVPLLMMIVGLGGGAAGGLLFVGPTFFGGPSEAAAEAPEGAEAEDGSDAEAGEDGTDGEGEDGAGEQPGDLHTIANFLVNPAGVGTRFLLVDVSLKLGGPDEIPALEAIDVELRDALGSLMASHSVDELTDMSGRDALKAEIKQAVEELAANVHVEGVYFPRFVIQ